MITQDSVVSAFDDILMAITWTVASIVGISLAVAGILVMNVSGSVLHKERRKLAY